MNKIFVFLGIALWSILIIENMVIWIPAYVFIDNSSTGWMLSLVSIIIWVFIWYWLNWMIWNKDWDDDNYDF